MKMQRILTIGGVLLTLAGAAISPLHAKPKSTDSLLFVQGAKYATLTPKNNKLGTYELKLTQVEPFVSYFTDAPQRATGQMLANEFYRNWKKAEVKPNVAMQSIDTATKMQINRIFTLTTPVYDAKTHTVTYQATLLGEQGLPKATLQLGYTELFIDDFEWDGNKFHRSGG